MDNCKVRKLKFSLVMLRNVSLKTIFHYMMCVHFVLQKSLHLNHQGMFEELHRNRNHQANKLSSCSNVFNI